MKISLWQLNKSFDALTRLAGQTLPKDQPQLIWKMKRVTSSAKKHMEDLADMIDGLMSQHGVVRNGVNDPRKLDDYNRQSTKFMKTTEIEIWGDAFKFGDLAPHVSISPLDLADLDWLIIEDENTEAKGAAAS